jgi:hypothetical protein
VTTVARLLPRHWDGRRLLQFLTGLALIALAFAVPALLQPTGQPEAPVTVITTVDTPPAGRLPVIVDPDRAATGTGRTGLALSPESTTATGDAAQADSDAAQAADGDAQAVAPVGSGTVRDPAGLPAQGRHSGWICVADRAAVGSTAGGSHSERGPPRA